MTKEQRQKRVDALFGKDVCVTCAFGEGGRAIGEINPLGNIAKIYDKPEDKLSFGCLLGLGSGTRPAKYKCSWYVRRINQEEIPLVEYLKIVETRKIARANRIWGFITVLVSVAFGYVIGKLDSIIKIFFMK